MSIEAPNRRAAALVGFMWVAYFLNYCDRQAISAMFPVLKSDLGLTDTQLGLTGSIFLWVYGFSCPIAGQLADKFSKRLLVVCSLAIWSIVTFATGLATSALMLLSLRAIMGISESLYMPAAVALTSNAHTASKRSRAVAALMSAQIAGLIGGAWFGGWMAQHGRWRGAFFALGAAGVIYAVPYFLFLRGVNEKRHEETTTTTTLSSVKRGMAVGELVKVPTFLLLCAVFSSFVFGLWLLYVWLPNFLHEKFLLGLEDAGFNATAFLQSATFVGTLGGGIVADWLYRRTEAARLWILTAALLLSAPCLHAIGSSTTLHMTLVSASGFGFFSGFFVGNIFPSAFEVVPAHTRASAVGLLNFCGALVSGFAALFGGIWKKTLGLEGLLTCTAIAYLVAGLALIAGIQLWFARDNQGIR